MPAPERADRPSIVAIQPRCLRERDAAAYLGLSAGGLRNLRSQDLKRQAKGEPIEGPRWVKLGGAVRYLVDDLNAYLDGLQEVRDDA